jgi:FMN phosphatase YigB (HAD superfamily)
MPFRALIFDYEGVLTPSESLDATCPFPDALAALQAARRSSFRVGVLSNLAPVDLEEALAQAGLAHLVDVTATSPACTPPNHDPLAYLKLVHEFALTPNECLYLGRTLRAVEYVRGLGGQAWLVDRSRRRHALAAGVVSNLSALSMLLAPAQPLSQRAAWPDTRVYRFA